MTLKLTVDQIAKVAHEVNREYSRSIGDPAKPSWEDAPEDQRVSCVKGIQYHLDNPQSLPSDSHGSWLSHKLEAGWRYGENIDPIRMTHPAMVPYEQLPKAQQAKDYIFLAICRQLTALEIKADVLVVPNVHGAGRYVAVNADAPLKVQGELVAIKEQDPDVTVAEKQAFSMADGSVIDFEKK